MKPLKSEYNETTRNAIALRVLFVFAEETTMKPPEFYTWATVFIGKQTDTNWYQFVSVTY